jgi:ABC-type transport system involved in multi-copper enzyme maturation permease subunit
MMMLFSPAVFKLSVRQLLRRHRLLLLGLLLCLAMTPALIALMIELYADVSPTELRTIQRGLYEGLTLAFVLPVITLILGGAILREEIQTQTILYLVLKPNPRAAVAFSKWAAAAVIALPLAVLSIWSSTSILGDEGLWAFFASGILATLAYLSFFFMLSLLVDRVLIVGFALLLAWEGVVAGFSKTAALLGIRVYARSVEQAFLGTSTPEVPLVNSTVVLLAISLLAVALAGWRLSQMEFPGSSD